MPKERFFNLPKEKQERIIDAAMQEISRVSIDEISINKIIQSAKIPRGSFYQYFEDKLDLIEYILNDFYNLLEDFAARSIKETKGDLFKIFLQFFDEILDIGLTKENFSFCKNIFTRLKVQQNFPFNMMRNRAEAMEHYAAALDISGYRFTRREEVIRVVEVIAVILKESVAEVFIDSGKREEVREEFIEKLKIIQYGVIKEGKG